jgi:N utilization substance protein B
VAHLEEVDDLIRKASLNWRIDRMATVDRNILRLATFELMRVADTPLKVVLNEAIEMSKRYGSEDSSAFVNGVLDKVGSIVRPGQKKS